MSRSRASVLATCTELAERYGLAPSAAARLARLVELLASDRRAPTSVRDPGEICDVHIADSLSAIPVLAELGRPDPVADVGSGAGLPGLVLAIALPQTTFELIESVGRKALFIAQAADALELSNVTVVCERAESWAADGGHERYQAVAARAVARLGVLLEYAAPLLVLGGSAILWKGELDDAERIAAEQAARKLGMSTPEPRAVTPYRESRGRHLWLSRKQAPTPERFPRRPGVAERKPP